MLQLEKQQVPAVTQPLVRSSRHLALFNPSQGTPRPSREVRVPAWEEGRYHVEMLRTNGKAGPGLRLGPTGPPASDSGSTPLPLNREQMPSHGWWLQRPAPAWRSPASARSSPRETGEQVAAGLRYLRPSPGPLSPGLPWLSICL